MPAAATRRAQRSKTTRPKPSTISIKETLFHLEYDYHGQIQVPDRWVEGTGYCRKRVSSRQSLPLTLHDQSISWDRPQNPFPCYSSNICKPLGPASQAAAFCSSGSNDGQHVWCFACLQDFWLHNRQATSANRGLGRRWLPTHASIAMAYGKWHLVDSTQDAVSRDLSCTTRKSVWHNNEHKIRSPCRTCRPTGKERRPYKAHVDTSDVACGSGLDCFFVHREAGM
jgi:hypothetical protein